jgi:hypothetical protein
VRSSPEDKRFWVEAGREKECEFVARVLPALGFNGDLNPAKKADPFAADLIVHGHLADLKCQRTPFFKAREVFGIDPRYAVTFNRKDYERYCEHYPSLDIYFWIDWHQTGRRIGGVDYEVTPLHGVWRASFPTLRHAIETGSVFSHDYLHRLFDTQGNARKSFGFDIRRFEFLGSSEATKDRTAWIEAD